MGAVDGGDTRSEAGANAQGTGAESGTPLRIVDRDTSIGPVVTPEPAPSDDLQMKLAAAAACGAIVGSFVAYRWLRRHVDVSL